MIAAEVERFSPTFTLLSVTVSEKPAPRTRASEEPVLEDKVRLASFITKAEKPADATAAAEKPARTCWWQLCDAPKATAPTPQVGFGPELPGRDRPRPQP